MRIQLLWDNLIIAERTGVTPRSLLPEPGVCSCCGQARPVSSYFQVIQNEDAVRNIQELQHNTRLEVRIVP